MDVVDQVATFEPLDGMTTLDGLGIGTTTIPPVEDGTAVENAEDDAPLVTETADVADKDGASEVVPD